MVRYSSIRPDAAGLGGKSRAADRGVVFPGSRESEELIGPRSSADLLTLQDLMQAELAHHLSFPFYRLGRYRGASAFGDPIHHLEVPEDRRGIDEAFLLDLVEQLFSRILLIPLAEQKSVYEIEECRPGRNPDISCTIGYASDLHVISEFLATPPESPCVAEHSVEALVE